MDGPFDDENLESSLSGVFPGERVAFSRPCFRGPLSTSATFAGIPERKKVYVSAVSKTALIVFIQEFTLWQSGTGGIILFRAAESSLSLYHHKISPYDDCWTPFQDLPPRLVFSQRWNDFADTSTEGKND